MKTQGFAEKSSAAVGDAASAPPDLEDPAQPFVPHEATATDTIIPKITRRGISPPEECDATRAPARNLAQTWGESVDRMSFVSSEVAVRRSGRWVKPLAIAIGV